MLTHIWLCYQITLETFHCVHYTASVDCCGKTLYDNDNRIKEYNTIDTRNSSLVYILLYKLIVECPWPHRGGWESFNSHDWWGLALISFALTDWERDRLWWPTLSGYWLPSTGCCQYLLNMKYLMYGLPCLQLSNSLGCFRPRNFFIKMHWAGLYGPPLYHIYILYSDNQQEGFRLSNWFYLRCLGPWMGHLTHVWWSYFRFIFLIKSWCVSLA